MASMGVGWVRRSSSPKATNLTELAVAHFWFNWAVRFANVLPEVPSPKTSLFALCVESSVGECISIKVSLVDMVKIIKCLSMEFRKMVTITLCMRQQKRHWCIDQSYGLCGRGRGWGDLGEWHWNMYNIMYETSHQSRFNARYWMLGAGALGRPRGRVWGGRREEGSGWGTQVYLWRIHFDIWQN